MADPQFTPENDPVVVISLFDGIGATWEALKIAGISPAQCYSSEILAPALGVLLLRQPQVQHLGDLLEITAERVQQMVQMAPKPCCILIVGGSPCQDNSTLKGEGRMGMEGPQSGLVWHMCNVINWTRQACTQDQRVEVVLENVAGTSQADIAAI